MPVSWLKACCLDVPRSRRRQALWGALQALESRALLSAVGVGHAGASVESPRVYGPLQLTASDSGTADADVSIAAEPPPLPVVQDYNGLWISDLTTSFQLQVNKTGTKIKGEFLSTDIGNHKLKGKLDGLEVTATVKGKTVSPSNEKGKLLINLFFTLDDPTHWSGGFEYFFKKSLVSDGKIDATKAT